MGRQPRDNNRPIFVRFNPRATFEPCPNGLREPDVPGPGSNVARSLKRTRLRRFAAPVHLTKQEIMSHPYIHFRTIVARGSNVAFGSLRPFGPGSNVARGLKRTRLRRFAAPVYLTNQEIMSHPYIHFGTIVACGSRTILSCV